MDKRGRITYCEPWKGLDKDGNAVLIDVTISMSVEDCINYQRIISEAHNKPEITDKMTDEDFLDEFMINHWAMRLLT